MKRSLLVKAIAEDMRVTAHEVVSEGPAAEHAERVCAQVLRNGPAAIPYMVVSTIRHLPGRPWTHVWSSCNCAAGKHRTLCKHVATALRLAVDGLTPLDPAVAHTSGGGSDSGDVTGRMHRRPRRRVLLSSESEEGAPVAKRQRLQNLRKDFRGLEKPVSSAAALPVSQPVVVGTLLGGPGPDASQATHDMEVALFLAGVIHETGPSEREQKKNPRIRGPPEFAELLRNGYIHPDYGWAPRGYTWSTQPDAEGPVYSLSRKGG